MRHGEKKVDCKNKSIVFLYFVFLSFHSPRSAHVYMGHIYI